MSVSASNVFCGVSKCGIFNFETNFFQMRGKLIGHRIKYWPRHLNETKDSQYLLSRSSNPNALIIGLQPNAYYWVSKTCLLV